MARFFVRATRAVIGALGGPECPRPFSGLFLASAFPPAAGHLGLARASSPALRDLLSPGTFLLDATHALGAVALRDGSSTVMENRLLRGDVLPRELARAEAMGDPKGVVDAHVYMAVLDAGFGRYEEALDHLTRLAAEHPDGHLARICAGALCDVLGRADEGNRWLAGIPEYACPCPREHISFRVALMAATLGGAPGAFTDSKCQGRVAFAAFQTINDSVSAGNMSAFQIIIAGLLKIAAKRRCNDLALERGDGIVRAVANAISISMTGSVPKGDASYVLKASQALLSAVVLHAHPLSVESVSTALRVAERDLARAVGEGDAAAVTDLRLLLAILATRDGRFDHALAMYEEVARDDPSDPRPHFLAASLCGLVRRPPEEGHKWTAGYLRLARASSRDDHLALKVLRDELVVALAVASPAAFNLRFPVTMRFIVCAAGSRVDAALVSALRTKDLSVMERMEARASRAFLHAGMWSALKDLEGKDGGSGTSTA